MQKLTPQQLKKLKKNERKLYLYLMKEKDDKR